VAVFRHARSCRRGGQVRRRACPGRGRVGTGWLFVCEAPMRCSSGHDSDRGTPRRSCGRPRGTPGRAIGFAGTTDTRASTRRLSAPCARRSPLRAPAPRSAIGRGRLACVAVPARHPALEVERAGPAVASPTRRRRVSRARPRGGCSEDLHRRPRDRSARHGHQLAGWPGRAWP
jgi:hypothetical protein